MTLCTIYNATGGNLTFVRNHSWSGDVWSSPYPHIILNGQWAAFLHVRSRNRSKEAVVYRGSNLDGRPREWVLAWDTVSEFPLQNRVYTEVRETTATINWNTVSSNMDRNLANHVVSSLRCFSSVAIGSTAAPHFTGIMSLDGVTNRDSMASDAISAILPVSLDSDHIGDDETTTPATPAAAPAAE